MNKKSIDIVTTGIIRPEILDLTYKSFLNGIVNLPPFRIIINLDPLGGTCVDESIRIVEKYCENPIIRTPKTPNFMEAVKWCWSQVASDLFIHLEDDWILNRKIDFNDWHYSIVESNAIQSVLLMKRAEMYNYSFRPHLASSKVCELVTELPKNGNPEKEMALLTLKHGLKSISYGSPYAITDTGRKWAKYHGLKKKDDSEGWFQQNAAKTINKLEYKLWMGLWNHRVKSVNEESNAENI